MTEPTANQISYASSLLIRLGYGERVSVAWRPLLRRLDISPSPGIGTSADGWLRTLSKRQVSQLIEALRDD